MSKNINEKIIIVSLGLILVLSSFPIIIGTVNSECDSSSSRARGTMDEDVQGDFGDNQGYATALSRTGLPWTLIGNLPNTGDYDWFKIDLNAESGATYVDNLTVTVTSMDGWWYTMVIAIYGEFEDGDDGLILLRTEEYTEWSSPKPIAWAHAYRTGTYYIKLQEPFAGTGQIDYTLTVAVQQVKPEDYNNVIDDAFDTVAPPVQMNLTVSMDRDMFDWYVIDSPEPDKYETNFSLEFEIIDSPDIKILYSDPAIYFYTIAIILIYHEDPPDSGEYSGKVVMCNKQNQYGFNSSFNYTEFTNAPRTWVGIYVQVIGRDENGNELGYELGDGFMEGWIKYNITKLTAVPMIPPILTNRSVEPLNGTLNDIFNFKVTYNHAGGNPPVYVILTIDGKDYPMAECSGGDYTTGMVFERTFVGETLTDNPYPHSYHFSTADYQVKSRLPNEVIGDFHDLKIVDNERPYTLETAPKTLIRQEDDETYELELNKIFRDPDGNEELEYDVWVGPEEDDYGSSYESTLLDVSLSDRKLKFSLKEDQHGIEVIRLRTTDTCKYFDKINLIMDFHYFRAYHNITVKINSVNDKPDIDYFKDQILTEDEIFNLTITASDIDIETDGDILTFETNVTDGLGDDDLPNFSIQPNTTTPTSSVDISFLPTNENVGDIWIQITVMDINESIESLNVKFTVNNVNDAPDFVTIGDKNVITGEEVKFIDKEAAIEDEWFNITIEVQDVDLEVGGDDELTFKTNITDDKGNDDLSNFFITQNPINQEQAQIAFLPTNENVGFLQFNLTVYDGKGGMNWTNVIIEIKNVNDPPYIPQIINPKSAKTTFSIAETINFIGECDDPDLHVSNFNEVLTFTWTSNVTSVPIGVGKNILIEDLTEWFELGIIKIILTVSDKSNIRSVANLTIFITNDLDRDGIWDEWEVENGLNFYFKGDADEDHDHDGFSNLEEFLGDDGVPGGEDSYDPRDAKSCPKKLESKEDSSWIWYIFTLIVIVIIIFVIIIFMFFGLYLKKKKPGKEEGKFHEVYPSDGTVGMEKPIVSTSTPQQLIAPHSIQTPKMEPIKQIPQALYDRHMVVPPPRPKLPVTMPLLVPMLPPSRQPQYPPQQRPPRQMYPNRYPRQYPQRQQLQYPLKSEPEVKNNIVRWEDDETLKE